MTMIAHRCRACGHPDFGNPGGTDTPTIQDRESCGRIGCGCTAHGRRCEWGDPEAVPSYSSRPGARILQDESIVHPPGTVLVRIPPPQMITCACGECQALYAALTA